MPCIRPYAAAIGLLLGALAFAGRADADGAIAIGLPADVAKDGVAFGWVVEATTRQNAEREALKQCHEFREATESTRALCAVMRAFKNECVVIAMDPEAGTSGIGWAILPTRAAAETKAMADCRATAGRAREKFCQVAIARCDGGQR